MGNASVIRGVDSAIREKWLAVENHLSETRFRNLVRWTIWFGSVLDNVKKRFRKS